MIAIRMFGSRHNAQIGSSVDTNVVFPCPAGYRISALVFPVALSIRRRWKSSSFWIRCGK
jgi:hypothetical protein